jgi:hypothetical protein
MFSGGQMYLDSVPAAALPWFVAGWVATVVVVSALIYLIVRAVLGKTDPQKLPEVLRALSPLLQGLVRVLAKPPPGLPGNETSSPDAPTMQNRGTSDELSEKAS